MADRNIAYFLRQYKLNEICTCAKCNTYVFKSNIRNYPYRCLKCNEYLFSNEINKSQNKPTKIDYKAMKEVAVKYIKL